jgi:hypothetical protein
MLYGTEYGFRDEMMDDQILLTVPPLRDIFPVKKDEVGHCNTIHIFLGSEI